MTLLVRPVAVDDAPEVARIHVAGWRHAYPGLIDDAVLDALDVGQRERQWRAWLERAREGRDTEPGVRHEMLVAERDGAVVGWVTFGAARHAGREGWGELSALYVDPAAARGGIGGTLVRDAEQRLAAAGFRQAYLWVLQGNAPAEAAYERYGWVEDGVTLDDATSDPTRTLVDRARVRTLPQP